MNVDRRSGTHFDQEKPVLGDTCSGLVWTKHGVASSNINIYHRKSSPSDSDGSSGQLAVKHATEAAKILFGVSRWGHVYESHGSLVSVCCWA